MGDVTGWIVCYRNMKRPRYRDDGRQRGRRQPAGALVQPGAAGARVRRQAALRARAQRAVAGGPRAAPPLARAARAQLSRRPKPPPSPAPAPAPPHARMRLRVSSELLRVRKRQVMSH